MRSLTQGEERPPSGALAGPEALLTEAVAGGQCAGAVVQVRRDGEVLWHRAYGWAEIMPRRRAMRPDMLFDLASLTKLLVTVTGIVQVWERGGLDLDRPVEETVPGFGEAGKSAVSLRHLLTHTSGLPAWVRFYLHATAPEEAIGAICRTAPLTAPGTHVTYSDLGFLILGEVLRRSGGLPLDEYAQAHIAPPVGWTWTRYRPPSSWRDRCVATEIGNAYERSMAAEAGEGKGFPWRTETIVGEVHDGNCHYLFGGISGHAGLFSTADEVGRYGQALLDGGEGPGGRLFRPETIAEMTRDQSAEAVGEGYGLGWRVARGNQTLVGARASPQAFGHTGFTGTSLVVDPARALVIVLLTNRVHPSADTPGFPAFRQTFHEAVMAALA
jgi:CubicO group peptidase (beta-lactamase class C family)